jgi:hypothetical protein
MFPARALSGRPRRPRATRQVVVAVQVARVAVIGRSVLIVRTAERGVAPKVRLNRLAPKVRLK